MDRMPTEREVRATTRRPAATENLVFRYRLVDLAGRQVNVVERRGPLRRDDTIVVATSERWRIVSVLGTSATVARA